MLKMSLFMLCKIFYYNNLKELGAYHSNYSIDIQIVNNQLIVYCVYIQSLLEKIL